MTNQFPGATKMVLSPAAQAVLDAYGDFEAANTDAMAAALRAAQSHARSVCHPGPQGCGSRYGNGNPPTLEDAYECGFSDAVAIFSLVLSRIADELEKMSN
jgi:hypothetical protein